MSDVTTHLGLPLIAAGQAQKHVTHNEALAQLDALVQLACLDKDLTTPPAGPAEGDRYLVTTSAPTGTWAGLAGQVVRFTDGVWVGAVPAAGWVAYVADEKELYVFDGQGWGRLRSASSGSGGTVSGPVASLGINTQADTTNRLAVKADAALFAWDDVTPGAGDMRLTLNKKAAARDAGFVFQTGWSTRALFGTLGGDDFVLKTSPDGSAFATALTAAAATGIVTFGASPLAPTPAAGDSSTRLATTAYVDRAVSAGGGGSGGGPSSTDGLTEGTSHLYFTTARARASLSVSGSLAYNAATGVISYTAPTLAGVATSGAYADLTGRPVLFSGAYADLTGKPSLAAVATSGSATDLAAGTLPAARLPAATASALGGVKATVGSSGQFVTGIASDGSLTFATPAGGGTGSGGSSGGGSSGGSSAGPTRTAVADADYAILATDRTVAVTGITAARTLTLPAASAFPPGATLTVLDEGGACTGQRTITVQRAGGDTLNGLTAVALSAPYAFLALQSDGASRWTVVSRAPLQARSTFVDVSYHGAQGFGSTFTRVMMNAVTADPGSNWDSANSWYTCPRSGIYQITGTLRVLDSSPPGTQYGVGVYLSEEDGPWFLWHAVGGATRSTYPYNRMGYQTAGDRLRMFGFGNDDAKAFVVGLQIMLVAEAA